METTHSVGIDLGTTYSSIAYLNEQGEPVSLPNQEGELATPSVVLFKDDEVIVGTEALRNAIRYPDRVVQNAKRFVGDPTKKWNIAGKPYTPVDIATFVLKKLISAAQDQIGPIEQAVITVPAQFSDSQRHSTVEAGHRAGLKRVDIINEPVAAALCHVLGNEGLWFSDLANEQSIMVYDLGGGTFDLSLVKYHQDEVTVITSSGDLNLGGIDWNQALMRHVSEEWVREFGDDPRGNLESLQYLSNEAEQAKRSLSVRPKAAMACKLDGHRKTYQITVEQFEELTADLVEHTADITKRMLKDNGMGWAHVDVVLTTGGASRMPMVRRKLKELSGRTLNTTLSPDLSIAHGATYYSGMLLTNDKFAKSILSKKATTRLASVKQRSVNARALGILVRNPKTNKREPHYLLKANTPLPADVTNNYGTVVPNQKRVHLQIVESGTSDEHPPAKLGNCVIDGLPPNLPEGSEIAVTISYDAEARVHVSAKDVASGKRASTAIVRQENVVPQLASDHPDDLQMLEKSKPAESKPAAAKTQAAPRPKEKKKPQPQAERKPSGTEPAVRTRPATQPAPEPQPQKVEKQTIKPRAVPQPAASAKANDARKQQLERADQPVPLCNECGEALNSRGVCTACGAQPGVSPIMQSSPQPKPQAKPQQGQGQRRRKTRPQGQGTQPQTRPAAKPSRPAAPPIDDAEILELDQTASTRKPAQPARRKKPVAKQPPTARPRPKSQPQPAQPKPKKRKDDGEDEFWQLVDD